jgi:hypothetical protein
MGSRQEFKTLPFELRERHSALSLSEDELLDFALALEHTEILPDGLETNVRDILKGDT